jgi:NADH dehydrogenase
LALTIPQLQFLEANIQDERLVVDALAGAYGIVNAVSLYIEHGLETSHSVHVESAQRVAAQAHRAGVERLVHVSGIGADAASPSRYIRKRGEGELTVRAAFNDALFVRPAVMFGPDDAFLTTILKLLRQLPIYPMFGRGRTRLRQVYVEDVAEALLESCGEPRRIRQSSSSAARASIRDVPLLPRKVITSAPDGTASPASR